MRSITGRSCVMQVATEANQRQQPNDFAKLRLLVRSSIRGRQNKAGLLIKNHGSVARKDPNATIGPLLTNQWRNDAGYASSFTLRK